MLRIGQGIDAHRFAEGRKLVLGGVEIPFEKGLDGHSDADVLLHAIADSLLGAMAKGDIGRHFPDTDQQYKGISSLVLLKTVGEIMAKDGGTLQNIDATIIAQRPKVMPYVQQMTECIAQALNATPKHINIKATTTEKMGFTGREEGIAAMAIALVMFA